MFKLGKEDFSKAACVYILSYDLATKKADDIARMEFKTIICDEAHYLKSRDTKRSKLLLPILIKAKRVILMTGTPVLAKPVEIYNLLEALRPDICPTFRDFTQRYCDPQQGYYGMDYSGATCTSELHYILQSAFMVRRMKKDVLDQLPEKRR